MANHAHNSRSATDPSLDGRDDLALPVPTPEAPGADEVDSAALSLAVDAQDLGAEERFDEYGDWQDDFADAVGISRWREL
jgi:hypothetical protein